MAGDRGTGEGSGRTAGTGSEPADDPASTSGAAPTPDPGSARGAASAAGETSTPVAADPTPVADPAFGRGLWQAWPYVNWLLPVVLIASYSFSDSAGWDGFFLVLFSPLLVPALALLGSLPRFIMRRRGHTAAPVAMWAMLAAHWWGAAFFFWSIRGTGDSGSLGSMLGEALGLSERGEAAVGAVALGCVVVAWVAELTAAGASPQRSEVSPVAPNRALSLVSGLSFALVPLLLLGLGMLVSLVGPAPGAGGGTGSGLAGSADPTRPDGLGDTAEEARAVTDAEAVRARQARAWEQTQEAVVPLRASLAEEGWTLYNTDPNGIDPWSAREEGRYAVDVAWMLEREATVEQLFEAASAAVTDGGWSIVSTSTPDPDFHSLEAVGPEGHEAQIDVHPAHEPDDGVSLMRLTVRSPGYWAEGASADWSGMHDAAELDALLGFGVSAGAEQPEFSAYEWPPLSLVMTER